MRRTRHRPNNRGGCWLKPNRCYRSTVYCSSTWKVPVRAYVRAIHTEGHFNAQGLRFWGPQADFRRPPQHTYCTTLLELARTRHNAVAASQQVAACLHRKPSVGFPCPPCSVHNHYDHGVPYCSLDCFQAIGDGGRHQGTYLNNWSGGEQWVMSADVVLSIRVRLFRLFSVFATILVRFISSIFGIHDELTTGR